MAAAPRPSRRPSTPTTRAVRATTARAGAAQSRTRQRERGQVRRSGASGQPAQATTPQVAHTQDAATSAASTRSQARTERRAVGAYLTALETPGVRGRPLSGAELERRIAEGRARAEAQRGVARLLTLRDVHAWETSLARRRSGQGSRAQCREAFLTHAAAFGARHGIAWATWREAGVPVADLEAAGIPRG